MFRFPTLLLLFLLSVPAAAQDCDATAILEAVTLSLRQGQPEGINQRIDSALLCADDTTRLQLWLAKYTGYRNRSKERSALRAIQSGAEFLEPETPELLRFTYLVSLAEGHSGRREYVEAEHHYQEAIAMNAPGPPNLMARLHHVKGKLQKGYYEDPVGGEASIQQALAFFQQAKEPDAYLQGMILRSLGNSAQNSGDYALCLQYRKRELRLYQEFYASDHPNIAIANYNLGGVLYRLEDHQAALDAYTACHLAWEKEFEHPQQYKTMLHEAMGDMYWELGQQEEAVEFYDLSTSGEPTINRDSSEQLQQQGDSLLTQGAYTGAIANYQHALDFRRANFGSGHPLTVSCQNYLAGALGAAGMQADALLAYESSISLLADRPAIPQLLAAMAGKGKVLLQQAIAQQNNGLLEAAVAHLDSAVAHLDELLRSPLSEGAKAFWNARSQELLEDAIKAHVRFAQSSGQHQHLEQAFLLSEKSKAFLLAAAVQGSEAVTFAGIPEAVTAEEEDLRRQLLSYEAKVTGEEKRCSAMREKQLSVWRKKQAALQTAHQKLLGEIQADYPDFFRLKYQSGSLDFGQLQQTLSRQQTTLIDFFEGRETVFVFRLEGVEVSVREVPVTPQYLELVGGLSSLPANPEAFLEAPEQTYLRYCQLAGDLYQLLLGPVLSASPAPSQRLLLVPGGQLARLPFASLLTAPPEQQKRDYRTLPYLIRQYPISYAPSASLWVNATVAGRRNWGKLTYAGFAPDYGQLNSGDEAGAEILPEAGPEIDYANGLFSGNIFMGAAATERALRAQSADLLHLAAHAYLENESPLQSRLLLHPADSTEDGLLHAYEIYALRLPSQISLLSACHTAAGPLQRGEGILSLERAFHYAGSPTLLSTLWAAEDASTSTINRYFLAYLHEGLAKDVALQKAQLRYLEEGDPGILPPFYWAGLRLSGSSKALEGGRWLMGFLGILGLMGVFFGVWVYRRL